MIGKKIGFLNAVRARKTDSIPVWIFPSRERCRDKRSGILWRHHMGEEQFANAFKRALRLSGINKNGVPHSLRHSFATHLVESGTDIQTVQKLMGHRDMKTTMGYVHVQQKLGVTLQSPIDTLPAVAKTS